MVSEVTRAGDKSVEADWARPCRVFGVRLRIWDFVLKV